MFRLCCICLIAIVIFWCIKERYTTSFYITSRLSAQTIKKKHIIPRNNLLLTFNIQRMPYHTKPLWKLQRLVRRHSIILLQECFSNVMYDEIQYIFPDFYIAKGVMINYKLVNSGLAILSRYPIRSTTFIPYDDQDFLTSDILSEKGFLLVEILFHNKPIYIINTHLQSSSHLNKFDTALKQINQLLSYVKKLEHPFIIGGDFNVPYQKFPESSFTMYRTFLPTIYIHYDKDGKELDTSCVSKPYYKGFIFDYFITSHILLSSTHVIPSRYSDHIPVCTMISHIL